MDWKKFLAEIKDEKKVVSHAEFIGIERRIWTEVLEEYVPLTGYKKPQKRDIRILGIGCGNCPEALSLNQYFGSFKPKGKDSFKGVEFIGVDIKEGVIENTRSQYRIPDWSTYPPGLVPEPGYEFISGDANKIKDLVQGKFDVIVYTHPEILHREGVWSEIIDESSKLQKPKDLVIATVVMKEERETIIKRLQPHYEIKVNCENKFMRSDYSVQGERHKYVIMGLKR